MKHFFFLMLVLALPAMASAQSHATDKASWNVGGSAYFVSNSTGIEGERATSLAFQPAARYFVVPNLGVGAMAGLSYSAFGGQSATAWTAAPGFTYYFGSPDGVIRPILGASFGLMGGDGRDLGTNLDLSGGAIMMISPSVGLTAEAFYNNSLGQPSDRNAVGIRLGISTFVW